MEHDDIFSEAFDQASKAGIASACAETLKAGVSLFYSDPVTGMEIMEQPDGRKFEIRYIPGAPRGRHHEVIRELGRTAA
jgi:hypothetical protein